VHRGHSSGLSAEDDKSCPPYFSTVPILNNTGNFVLVFTLNSWSLRNFLIRRISNVRFTIQCYGTYCQCLSLLNSSVCSRFYAGEVPSYHSSEYEDNCLLVCCAN
jgi:hypothetical protein